MAAKLVINFKNGKHLYLDPINFWEFKDRFFMYLDPTNSLVEINTNNDEISSVIVEHYPPVKVKQKCNIKFK